MDSSIKLGGNKKSEYMTLDCIKCTGSQYIDTGIPTNTVGGLEVKWDRFEDSFYGRVFGSGAGNAQLQLMFLTDSSAACRTYRFINYNKGERDFNLGYDTSVFKMYDGTVYYYDTALGSYNISTTTNNLWFGRGADTYCRFAFYYIKVWDLNNNLLRDYIPLLRASDMVAGMYDQVTKKFYTSAGSSAFTKGNITGIY